MDRLEVCPHEYAMTPREQQRIKEWPLLAVFVSYFP